MNKSFFFSLFIAQATSIFFPFRMNINRCQANRSNAYGYLDLNILDEYADYGNSLCEFVFNSIVLDYVVRTSIRNHRSLIRNVQLSKPTCVSLFHINLDTDFLPYAEKMRRIW